MRVEKHITISDNFHQVIENSFDKISNELVDELRPHKDEINSLLTGYYCQERGTVYDHIIDQTSIETDGNGKGSFMINFDISYALEGYSDKDKMKIEFQIDLKTGKIILEGEEFA